MANVADFDLIAFVARLAPEVDRLFITGHRAAAPLARDLRAQLGSPRTVLVDFRKLLLAPPGMTQQQGEALERYRDREEIAATIEQHVEQGLVYRDGERIVLTPRGRDLLLRLTDILDRAVSGLWASAPTTTRAADTARAAVEMARNLPSDRYPAFSAERAGFMPDSPSPAMLLWSNLATLRYLRADAHALAWREAGLTVREVSILTDLRYKPDSRGVRSVPEGDDAAQGPVSVALEALRRRGWLATRDGGWIVTERGREARDVIERRTNELDALPYIDLDSRRREDFLHDLQILHDRPT
jgi:hypothetical protein